MCWERDPDLNIDELTQDQLDIAEIFAEAAEIVPHTYQGMTAMTRKDEYGKPDLEDQW